MTPEQRANYETEYRKTLERVLEKVTNDYIENIRIFQNKIDAQRNALQCALVAYQREMKAAVYELDKSFQ